jgi:hypothetical protein
MSLLDLSDVSVSAPGPIKPGKYVATVTEAKIEPLYSGKGKKLAATIKIAAGEYKGRTIYQNFNIQHENKDAEKIGKQQLKSMMIAMGLGDVLNSVGDLCGKAFAVSTKVEKDKETGVERARVSYFDKAESVPNVDLATVASASDDIPF